MLGMIRELCCCSAIFFLIIPPNTHTHTRTKHSSLSPTFCLLLSSCHCFRAIIWSRSCQLGVNDARQWDNVGMRRGKREKSEHGHTINNGGDYCGAVVCFTFGPASKQLSLVQRACTVQGRVRLHGLPAYTSAGPTRQLALYGNVRMFPTLRTQ